MAVESMVPPSTRMKSSCGLGARGTSRPASAKSAGDSRMEAAQKLVDQARASRLLTAVKGGGAALTREKIVAAQSRQFICIADESKLVTRLGKFPLPVEVIPMAARRIARQFAAMGGLGQVRMKDGAPLVTDNGQYILDVTGLQIEDPRAFELQVSQWPGVVTVGVFALQRAHVCLLGTGAGVKTMVF